MKPGNNFATASDTAGREWRDPAARSVTELCVNGPAVFMWLNMKRKETCVLGKATCFCRTDYNSVNEHGGETPAELTFSSLHCTHSNLKVNTGLIQGLFPH